MNVRVLDANDVSLLRSALPMFGRAFHDIDTYTAAQPSTEYLQQLLAGNLFVAIAAMQGQRVVGALAAYFLPKFEQERSEIYLYDLAVEEEHRRRGIATAMIDELRRVAASRGAYVIFVQADHGDDAAIALYAKLGAREDVIHFDLAVPA
jgi:ribosomal protein S18 acetylase RimI-like enzyme